MCLHSPIMNSNDSPCAFCAVVPSLLYVYKKEITLILCSKCEKKTNCDMKEIIKKKNNH